MPSQILLNLAAIPTPLVRWLLIGLMSRALNAWLTEPREKWTTSLSFPLILNEKQLNVLLCFSFCFTLCYGLAQQQQQHSAAEEQHTTMTWKTKSSPVLRIFDIVLFCFVYDYGLWSDDIGSSKWEKNKKRKNLKMAVLSVLHVLPVFFQLVVKYVLP